MTGSHQTTGDARKGGAIENKGELRMAGKYPLFTSHSDSLLDLMGM